MSPKGSEIYCPFPDLCLQTVALIYDVVALTLADVVDVDNVASHPGQVPLLLHVLRPLLKQSLL